MKGKRTLLILLGCLAVLILVLVLVLRSGSEGDPGEAPQTAEETAQASGEDLTLWSVDASQITAMAWESQSGSMDARRSGGTWVWESQPELDLDQAAMSALAETLSTLTASRRLDTTGVDLREFSLDAPSVTITFTALDRETSIALGVRNAGLSQDYALYQDQVYLIDTALMDAFGVSPYSLLANDYVPSLNDAQITGLTVQTADAVLNLVQPEEPEQYTYCDAYTWFAAFPDVYTALGNSQVHALVRQVIHLDLSVCLGTDVPLPEESSRVTVTYTNTDEAGVKATASYTLLFGPLPDLEQTIDLDVSEGLDAAEEEDDPVLVRVEGSDLVYSLPAQDVRAILDTTVDDLLPEDICPIPFAELQAFTFLVGGEEYRVDVLTQESGTVYALNGTTIDRSTANRLYSQLTGLAVEATVSDSDRSTDDAAMQVKLYRNRETYSVMTLSLIPYDSSFYVVDFAGQQRLLVNIRDVDALIESLRETAGTS